MGPGVLKGFWLLRDTLEPSWGHLGSATSEGSPHNADMFIPQESHPFLDQLVIFHKIKMYRHLPFDTKYENMKTLMSADNVNICQEFSRVGAALSKHSTYCKFT